MGGYCRHQRWDYILNTGDIMKINHMLYAASLAVICLAWVTPVHADDTGTKPALVEDRLRWVFANKVDNPELAKKTNENPPENVETDGILMAIDGNNLTAKMKVCRSAPSSPGISDSCDQPLIGSEIYSASLKVPLDDLKKAGFAAIPHEPAKTSWFAKINDGINNLTPDTIAVRIFEIKPSDKTDADSLSKRSDFVDDSLVGCAVNQAFHHEYAKIKANRNRDAAIEAARKNAEALTRH